MEEQNNKQNYDMVINYGKNAYDTAYEALCASDLAQRVPSGASVLIKPNLVMAKPASSGATTHPEVVRALIVYLRETGIKSITIAESSWTGGDTKAAFEVCGYNVLSREFDVPLIDLKTDKTRVVNVGGTDLKICAASLDCDFLINVPVLKAHCQTLVTCCLKNLKGVIPDDEKRRYHTIGLHRPIALLNKAVKTHFCLVDGICGDLSFEEGGNPIRRDMVIAGRDPVLIDSYAAAQLGYEAAEVDYIVYAQKIGIGQFYNQNTQTLVLNADKKPIIKTAEDSAASYKHLINEKAACSACYAALISALRKTGGGRRGDASGKDGRIAIGQGFKGEAGETLGIGGCCAGFARFVPGCPPNASEIVKFLS